MRKWLVPVLVMLALARLARPRAAAQPCEQRLPASLAEAGSDGQTFADVSPSQPFYAEIEWLYQNGFSAGRPAHPLGYSSDVTINRAESTVFVEHEIHGANLLLSSRLNPLPRPSPMVR